jgi:hypothetical protein
VQGPRVKLDELLFSRLPNPQISPWITYPPCSLNPSPWPLFTTHCSSPVPSESSAFQVTGYKFLQPIEILWYLFEMNLVFGYFKKISGSKAAFWYPTPILRVFYIFGQKLLFFRKIQISISLQGGLDSNLLYI